MDDKLTSKEPNHLWNLTGIFTSTIRGCLFSPEYSEYTNSDGAGNFLKVIEIVTLSGKWT